MGPFWKGLGEDLKNRGRNPTLFLIAVVLFFGLMGLAWLGYESGFARYLLRALPGMGVLVLAWAAHAIRQARARRHARLPLPPLSCDELRAARSKLVKDRNRQRA